MCGITGLYSANNGQINVLETCKNMTATIARRGPDGHGVWADSTGHLALGHRRLSILDLSETGAQPMHSTCGRFTITYNGEIYNSPTLRANLEARGYAFKGTSDTEVLLASISEHGLEQTLNDIYGMFAFALWDDQLKTLSFARDRFGKKPLYIGWAERDLVFGSELKALRAHPKFKSEIDLDTLGQYLRYGYINAPNCIYKNVMTLPPAHYMTISTDNIQAKMPFKSKKYWSNKDKNINQNIDKKENIKNIIKETLSQSVKERMLSDVPLGAFLSGGIDSSLITALMQEQSADKIKTFTIGFDVNAYSEAGHAREVAKHLGTDHHELMVSAKEAQDIIPNLPEMHDEPFSDMSTIPTAILSQFTRQHVTVALSGDGGDELFGGYRRHQALPDIWRTLSRIPKPLRTLCTNTAQSIPAEWFKYLGQDAQDINRIRKLQQILGADSYKDLYERSLMRWPTLPLSPEVYKSFGSNQSDLEWHAAFDDANDAYAQQVMHADLCGYMPDNVLVKVDRASMYYALEARAPFLDPNVFEVAQRVPLDMKIKNKKGKWILRQILKDYIPENLFERPKQGFSVPIDDWLRGDLKEWAHTLLKPKKIEEHNLLDADLIDKKWSNHLSGRENNGDQLWTILMLQTWLENHN